MVYRLHVEMSKKLFGMYASVGPPATYGFNGLAQDSGERSIQYFLNSYRVWLCLPSMVIGAVVKEFDKIALGGHGGKGSEC